MVMKTLISAALVGLALAGCTSTDQQARDACPRVRPHLISVRCYNEQLARLRARDQANENAAAMMLMGGTAFVNGYNSGAAGPLPMVNQGGRLTIYSGAGGVMQGY